MTGEKRWVRLVRQLWRYYLPVLVYFLLAFLLFGWASVSAQQNTQLSLRYTDEPVTPTMASQVAGQMQDPGTTLDFSVAFWRQVDSLFLETDYGSATTPAVYADGDLQGIYPANFLQGTYPTGLDNGGVAVSEGLAWQLWGGADLVGTEFEWEGKKYVIRGVFEGVEPAILFQESAADMKEGGYTGVELYGTPEGDPRSAALEFASTLGLGTPNAIVSGPSMAALMMFMAVLPALILVVWFLAKLMGQVHRLPYWPKQAVWFLFLLGVALAVPALLNLLPAWVIPNKWSDLDTWSVFFTSMNERINEWLALYPALRDVDMKRQLLRQALVMVPCLFAVTVTIRVWNARIAAAKPAKAAVESEDGAEGDEGPNPGGEEDTEDTVLPDFEDEYAELLR